MSEIHALSGAYAVDAVNPTERKLFEQHLAHCPDCQAEVASLREAASLLPETTAVAPPPALRDRLLSEIAAVRPLPPLTDDSPVEPAPTVTSLDSRRRRRVRPMLAAAAAVVAMIGAGAVVLEPWEDDGTQQRELTAAERVLAADDAEKVRHEFPDGAVATVVRSQELGQAVITTSDMPAAPAGKVYQLWLQDPNGEMLSAGLMPPVSDQTVLLEGDAAAASGAGITVEPAGGSDSPTTAPVVVFDFVDGAV
jgi:anti-sigma-K factor RskA